MLYIEFAPHIISHSLLFQHQSCTNMVAGFPEAGRNLSLVTSRESPFWFAPPQYKYLFQKVTSSTGKPLPNLSKWLQVMSSDRPQNKGGVTTRTHAHCAHCFFSSGGQLGLWAPNPLPPFPQGKFNVIFSHCCSNLCISFSLPPLHQILSLPAFCASTPS